MPMVVPHPYQYPVQGVFLQDLFNFIGSLSDFQAQKPERYIFSENCNEQQFVIDFAEMDAFALALME
jgi:hypothetical protein